MQFALQRKGEYFGVDIPRAICLAYLERALKKMEQSLYSLIMDTKTALVRRLEAESNVTSPISKTFLGDVYSSIEAWTPKLKPFQANTMNCCAEVLQKHFHADWSQCYERGPKCMQNMRHKFQTWLTTHRSKIMKLIQDTAQTECVLTMNRMCKELQMIHQTCFIQLLKIPQIVTDPEILNGITDLSDAILPARVADTNFERQVRQSMEHIERKQYALIPQPRLSSSIEFKSAFNDLILFIDQNKEILTPVSEDQFLFHSKMEIGTVYVISTKAYEKVGLYKIGSTTKTLAGRMTNLYTTGVSHPFKQSATWACNYLELFEKYLMHVIFSKVRENRSREFFECPLTLIQRVGDLVNKTLEHLPGAQSSILVEASPNSPSKNKNISKEAKPSKASEAKDMADTSFVGVKEREKKRKNSDTRVVQSKSKTKKTKTEKEREDIEMQSESSRDNKEGEEDEEEEEEEEEEHNEEEEEEG